MKNKEKSVYILLIALGIYGIKKIYDNYKYRKKKAIDDLYSHGKYEEYLFALKDTTLSPEDLIKYIYSCHMTFDYTTLLSKSQNYFREVKDDASLVSICKLRINAGIEILEEDLIFKDIIFLTSVNDENFDGIESLILEERFRKYDKNICRIDFDKLQGLLDTFPELYKEYKSHEIGLMLQNKSYNSLPMIDDSNPYFRFLHYIIKFVKFNNKTLIYNLKDESFSYSKMYYEFIHSQKKEIQPSFYKKENVSSCFYKALIFRNDNDKENYLSWISKSFNYKNCEFVYVELIKESISLGDYKKAFDLSCKASDAFSSDLLLLLKIKVMILLKNTENVREELSFIKNRNHEYYFIRSFIEERISNLLIAYQLNENSYLINFNLALALMKSHDIDCMIYFTNCLHFSLESTIYFKLFCVVEYLKVINELIEIFPHKKIPLFNLLLKKFKFEFIMFN